MMVEVEKYCVIQDGRTFAVGEWQVDEQSEIGSYRIICRGIDDEIVAKNIARACKAERPEKGDFM